MFAINIILGIFYLNYVKSGPSSVVEHNLAKVGVEGSNPFARSIFQVSRSKDRVPSDCFQAINVREQEFGVLWCG